MKVLIIGLGSIAKKHIAALGQISSEVEIYALRRSIIEEENDIKHIYSFEEIEEVKPDFIIVSNPTNIHYQTLKRIYGFNLPLFIEKPLFNLIGKNESELVEIISKNNSTYIACNLRFHKGLVKMRSLLEDKCIEEVNVYCGSYLPDWRPTINFRESYSANAEKGGGVHIDLIHELDYLYWFFGEPLEVNKTFKSDSSLNITAIDYANYLFSFNDFCANIVLNYYRRDAKRTFEIVTNKETYLLDLLNNIIYVNGEKMFDFEQTVQEMYDFQMNFFIEKILIGEKFNDIKEGYKVLELCLKD
ncbi:Gfo/Idh/MocA family protein [Aquimarina agarilytica]|uniref:Gfo/Idh/MocA family protein n=1 Tax=Aquimarina agarilytica TaxID=1087449 RepID=UPI000288BDD7|nr:Gfo/Idh/MocA family oxidoreductase [Aquimarina agarilytica]